MTTSDDPGIDFRAVCRLLHHARIERQVLDVTGRRLELAITRSDGDGTGRASLVFEGITQFRWQGDSPAPSQPLELPVVGLERLAADDVWRLYIAPAPGATVELSCARITCDGAEVQGIGRSYAADPAP